MNGNHKQNFYYKCLEHYEEFLKEKYHSWVNEHLDYNRYLIKQDPS